VIVPTLVFPPAIPSTAQLTVWFVVPLTVTLYCCVPLIPIDAFAGVIVTVKDVTLRVVVALKALLFQEAWIVVDPTPAPVASPTEVIEAIPLGVEVHATEVVTS
jgi:hypothetical protein